MERKMSDNNYNEFDDSRYAYETVSSFGRPKTMAWSLISMITGILSLALSFFGWAAIALGAIAIICSAVSRKILGYFDKMSVVGLIIGIFGAVCGAAILFALAFAGEDFWQTFLEFFLEGYESLPDGGEGNPGGGNM